MNTATAVACVALMLAGCAASGDDKRLDSSAGAASQGGAVAAGGSGTIDATLGQGSGMTPVGTSPISPDKQAAFCQDEVAFRVKAELQHATVGERVVAADGSTTIDVTIDNGMAGAKTFKCRLDASNRFIDVIASDAAL